MREVQYGDKSRMEMPVPGSSAAAEDENSPWNITQGLLAIELMTGNLQVGDNTFIPYPPAEIPVAGDRLNNPGPTYADMGVYMEYGARTTGWTISQYFDDTGVVQDDDRFLDYGVYDRIYIEQTDHNIASVFWDFMQSEGLVYEDGALTNGPLFLNEFYAIGYPVTEAYWSESLLQNRVQDILIQCFERRCLTFAPDNEPEWQVESGNVGLHYHEWRYSIIGDPIITPDPELSLVLDPVDATNVVGTEYTLTATLMEDGTALAIGDAADVSIAVERGDDDDYDVNENITVNQAGVASITYTGPAEPAVDTIVVTVDHNGEDITATATKTWADFNVALDQVHAANLVGTEHAFTATLTSVGSGDVVDFAESDVNITITRGTDTLTPSDLTIDSITDGVATITYTGPGSPTMDELDVSVTVLGTAFVGEPTLTKTWQTFEDFYECDTVVEDGESIQAAVNEATEGDTICVLAGTYNENIVIDVNGLTLLGANTGIDASSTTNGDRGAESEIQGSLTSGSSGVDGLTIDGFTIATTAGDGVFVRGFETVISNNIITGPFATSGTASGIKTADKAGATADISYVIEHNYIEGFRYGLLLDGSRLKTSSFTSNTVTGAERAVQTLGGASVTSGDSHTFVGNKIENNVRGFRLAQSGHTVTDNIIAGNTDYGMHVGVTGDASLNLGSTDATCNWWGNANGPDGVGSGDGDVLIDEYGNVVFSPWRTAPDGPCDGVTP